MSLRPASLTALPIDALLPALLASLAKTPNLVLEAAPGAGKTTRVPPALLGLVRGEVLVLEPRRIAARLAAARVAAELGERVGETVGYQVRFDEAAGPRTRLRFVTEGILTRRLLSDPELAGVDAVVLDEFHERHLDGDLALALLRRLQRGRRPELRLVVMSATLDAAPVVQFLGGCPVLRSEGRQYPLMVRHLPYAPEPLHAQVRRAVETLVGEAETGHVLAFLPGAAEIRRGMRECEAVARRAGLLVLPLYADLPAEEQDRALAPSRQQKLILATNVAESSVTVEGVTAVIDSGVARMASHSPWTTMPTLAVSRISRASATHRAGRAGRTGPGRVLRLYPEEDLRLRSEHDLPEIARSDLAPLALQLRAMGLDLSPDAWLDPPPPAALAEAEALLDRLGASGEHARQMARLPLPPRLARVLLESMARGVAGDGCRAAALLSLQVQRTHLDLLEALDKPPAGPEAARLRQHTTQLKRLLRGAPEDRHDDEALLLALVTGYPDRVARRRAGREIVLPNGLAAELAGEPPQYEFLLALEVEDRTEHRLPLCCRTARVEPEWLLDLFPERVAERVTVAWNRAGERVEQVSALVYDGANGPGLVLSETRGAAHGPEAAALLARKALELGVERFVERETFEPLLARLAFAGLPAPEPEQALAELCEGLQSFAELREAARNLLPLLESRAGSQRLAELAPATLRLPGGRTTRVHYEVDKPPWIGSRLADFFGMRETPRIGPGRTPVVVHLLAPNGRAVQTTTDLTGFWERLYPQVRRELMRRYPRHPWPEKP